MIGKTELKRINTEVQLMENLGYSRSTVLISIKIISLYFIQFMFHLTLIFWAVYFIHNINKSEHIKKRLIKLYLL